MSLEGVRRLAREELPVDTIEMARWLIGKTLVHDLPGEAGTVRLAGRIVETEAYLPGDAASHSFRGPTARNRSMYLRPGHAYVYIAYGVWPALNVSSETEGVGAAVLLRSLEVLSSLEAMQRRWPGLGPRQLASGPGRLARAMQVSPAHDTADLCEAAGPLWLGSALRPPDGIASSARIGITKAAERRLRFFEPGNPAVSGPARLNRA
jgi:DNA-3-methyladenine glycosylase